MYPYFDEDIGLKTSYKIYKDYQLIAFLVIFVIFIILYN